MKKIYLLLCAAGLATTLQAQQTLKVKFNKNGTEAKRSKNALAQRNGNPGNSPLQVKTTIVANNGYVANTTMNINFSITNTNTDAEYIDSLAITFPATFTVNSSPNATFPTADAGGGAESLNGVNGQTISWGINNNDQWGGIWANPSQSFDINVSVASGTTGPQKVHYFASGDGFGSAPGDYVDSFLIPEMQPLDAKIIGVKGFGISCSLTNSEVITAYVKNFGINPITSLNATYIINGGTPVVETATVNILPGDTLTYNFTTTANLSAANMYHIFVGATTAGDADLSNDTTSIMAENYAPQNIAASPLTMGFEAGADSIALKYWVVENANADAATWALINTYNHSGSRCLRKPGSATNDDDWLFTNCLDLQASNTYRLEYYYKNFELTAPCSLEVSIGAGANSAAMTQSIVQNPIPTDTMYQQVVVLFTVPTTGTYNMGFHAYATAGTSSIRIDDINIAMSPVGVNENKNTKQIAVYPNPSNGLFYINASNANTQIEVFTIVGEKVLTKTQLNKGVNAIDLSSVSEGSYFVRIMNGSEVTTKKIVVTK